ncbi:MAG TPA: ribonuclease HI [Terriglobia bacterium]|nr:ribonuclease HI [Terriglobia bacterium]
MKKVVVTTDGACIGNPGPGGWACILRSGRVAREMYGSEPRTTNNRMELRAVIEGLRALREPCQVTVYTDSEYVRKGITEWLERWKLNGWKKRDKGKVVNQDLWMELDQAAQQHRIRWEWVRGHASHVDNLRCDFLANRAAREQISSPGSTRTVEANDGVETQHPSRLLT